MIQNLIDGILTGSYLSLGAIGLTLGMHILRFANFSHAELLSLGAYAALVFEALLSGLAPVYATKLAPLSLTVSLILAIIASMVLTGLSALLIDRLVLKRVREKGQELSMGCASFGRALILRNVIGLIFGRSPELYSRDIAFAMVISQDPFILVKPDQVFVLIAALVLMFILHLILSRTTFGYALRALAENPSLAQVNGVNLHRTIMAVWLIGGGLAAVAGVFYGLSHRLIPVMSRPHGLFGEART